MAKRRRPGTVQAPSLDELLSPDRGPASSMKRPRLESSRSLNNWTVDDVAEHLRRAGLQDIVVTAFRKNDISGRHLLNMTIEKLQAMGLQPSEQVEVQSVIKHLNKMSIAGMEKVFNDPIHGHIELHPLMVKIIDTPQFQRLRNIKQLGGAYHVFMGASHNRFEHSIGVGYLAGELVSMLQNKQPTLNITEQDLLCVKIAGLCHDLGHGPFSHLFDGMFIPCVLPEKHWKHEKASVMMFDYLVESNSLRPEFERHGLLDKDLNFIKEQIAGPIESELSSQASDWPYSGRPKEKSFLYEVVANKRNGIDVDKWDYFARDCHCLGIPNNFDLRRFMAFARVIEVNDRRQICTRDKEVGNLYEMFHTRISLHRRAYQHKTSNIIEYMITEALVKADPHIRLQGSNGAMVRMSEAIDDPVAYTKLTDHILHTIMESADPKLTEAKKLIENIEYRKLYKCVGQTSPPSGKYYVKSDSRRIAEEVIDSCESMDGLPSLMPDDLVVDIVTFDYGMGEKNPIDHMSFYSKHNPERAIKVRKDQVSELLPQKFKEQSIRVYCKRLEEKSHKSAENYFINWCKKNSGLSLKDCGLSPPMDVNEDFTPYGSPFKPHDSRESFRGAQGSDKTPTVRQLF